MKVLILAGGFGTRLGEETTIIPKPMIKIGDKPIIWHIMKIYSHYGFNEFILLLGYKGYVLKEYFANYFLHKNDIKIDLKENKLEILNNSTESWKITLIDTGIDTMTGGRLKRAEKYIDNKTFMFTYGDGVSNINISKLVEFHRNNKKLITMTTIKPEEKYGAAEIDENNRIIKFMEKPKTGWANGGFFVCEPEIFKYIKNDSTFFELEPLQSLANNNQLMAFKHNGFWKCMDTLKDKNELNSMWNNRRAEWKVWE